MDPTAQVCSQCGWAFDTDALRANACRKCKSAILVTSIAYLEKFERPAIQKYITQYAATLKVSPTDRDALVALGICYLKLGLYEVSDKFLAQLVDAHPADPTGYYYRAITLLKGKRPRTASLALVREAERLAATALELDPGNGRYEVFVAALQHDYYVLNGLRVPGPGVRELAQAAAEKHLDRQEIAQVFELLRIPDGPVRAAFVADAANQ